MVPVCGGEGQPDNSRLLRVSAGLDVDVRIGILVWVIVEGRGRRELSDDGILHASIEITWRGTDAKASALHPQLELGGLVINVWPTSWSQHEPRGASIPLPRGAFLYLHLMNHLDGVGLRGGYWGGPADFRPPRS
ncbi:hypothetical protein E2C01_001602 [Portunus trituberculatus]|uniref:Uncharacterized protein n=1 Tax=Portunus trituberculatus TaxID=210409 RepID=A0A5B7CJU8_PORTR|nr:hypothetical protein [Portunus trituberculatus]